MQHWGIVDEVQLPDWVFPKPSVEQRYESQWDYGTFSTADYSTLTS